MVKARWRGKINVRFKQSNHNHNYNHNLIVFYTVEINLDYNNFLNSKFGEILTFNIFEISLDFQVGLTYI